MIQVQKRKQVKGSYQVELRRADGSIDEYKVSEDLIVEFRLIEGKMLDDFAFVSFLNAVKTDAVFQKLLRQIARQPKTKIEIESSLQASELTATEQANVLAKLEHLRLIDDLAFAQRFADYQTEVLLCGPKKLAYDLERRGISPDLVKTTLDAIDESVYTRHLDRIWAKLEPRLQAKSTFAAQTMAKRRFYELGYPDAIVQPYLTGKLAVFAITKNDHDLLSREYAKVMKRLSAESLNPYQMKQKIIQRLVQKGFRYDDIRSMIEGGFTDESQNL
jgi:regulatory protein